MTRLTALEIFSNPDCLMFNIGYFAEEEKYSFAIFRGSGHNHKPLLSSRPFAKNKEEAVGALKIILDKIVEDSGRELRDRSSLTSRVLNPENNPTDKLGVLNKKLTEWIVKRLKNESCVLTREFFAEAS